MRGPRVYPAILTIPLFEIMMNRLIPTVFLLLFLAGCASIKQSDTARTGIEQLLISSATDTALNKIDLRPMAGSKVYIEEKYLDCVDKNYVLVALRQKIMRNNCTLAAKAEEADVVLEVASGGVGTDRSDLFLGIPQIPLPPPSPISIPKLALFERVRAMGTVKLVVVAYDAKTHMPVVNADYAIARADHRNWNVLALGAVNSGSVHDELVTQAGDNESLLGAPKDLLAATKQTTSSIARRPARQTTPLPPVH